MKMRDLDPSTPRRTGFPQSRASFKDALKGKFPSEGRTSPYSRPKVTLCYSSTGGRECAKQWGKREEVRPQHSGESERANQRPRRNGLEEYEERVGKRQRGHAPADQRGQVPHLAPVVRAALWVQQVRPYSPRRVRMK